MSKPLLTMGLLALTLFASAAQAQVSPQMQQQQDALVKCQKYEFKGPHPLIPNTERHVQVHGIVDGKCLYTETLPNNGLLSCSLTDAQRQELAAKGWMAVFNGISNDGNTCKVSGY